MGTLPSPPICPVCDDHYEPHDHPDYQGFCSQSCWDEANVSGRDDPESISNLMIQGDAMSATGDGLTQWVIYDHPADFPQHFVVRPWTVVGGGRIEPGSARLCASIEQARALLKPLGLYRLDRQPDDDPAIAEVWL